MSVIIRLDVNALNALFPEGSESRVELQNSVVAEFARKHLKPSTLKVTSLLETAKTQLVNETLRELGAKISYHSVVLPLSVQKQIKEDTEKAVQTHISKAVATAMSDTATQELVEHLQASIEAKLDKELTAMIQRRVNDVMSQMFGKTS